MRVSRNRWLAKRPDRLADWGSYVALPILIGAAAVVLVASSKRRRNPKREFRGKISDDFSTMRPPPRPLRTIESLPPAPVVVPIPPVVPVQIPPRETPPYSRAGYRLTIAALILVGTAALAFAAIYRFRPTPQPVTEPAGTYSTVTPTPTILESTRPPFFEAPTATPQMTAMEAAMPSPSLSPPPSATPLEQLKSRHRKVHRHRSARARSLNNVLKKLF